MIEEFENDAELKRHGYNVGTHGAYKEFKSRTGVKDIVVFVYDDGRVRYKTGDASLDTKIMADRHAINEIKSDRDLDSIDKYINDFMIEYGFIDDGFEVDAVEDEFED
jgi:hypothetical protein